MSSFLPDGFTLRRGRSDDVEPVTELVVVEEQAVRGSSQWTQSDTRDWFHDLSIGGEFWVVEEGTRLVGVLGLFRGDLGRAWISVDPGSTGRGIGSALLGLAEQRARELGAARLTLLAFAENEPATRLLERAGYRDDRHFYRMEVELAERPVEPDWPNGIACTTFGVADARAFHDAVNEAFADDYGHHPIPFEEWKRMRLETPHFDPSLWFVARDADQIAGVCRCTKQRWGCGWIDALGVRRQWRRRGVGSALLQHSFRELYDRGEHRVGLGVDTQNPSGATRLYERAGMHVVAENIIFEKTLT